MSISVAGSLRDRLCSFSFMTGMKPRSVVANSQIFSRASCVVSSAAAAFRCAFTPALLTSSIAPYRLTTTWNGLCTRALTNTCEAFLPAAFRLARGAVNWPAASLR